MFGLTSIFSPMSWLITMLQVSDTSDMNNITFLTGGFLGCALGWIRTIFFPINDNPINDNHIMGVAVFGSLDFGLCFTNVAAVILFELISRNWTNAAALPSNE